MTEGREGMLFVGGFAHPPNEDGVLWFAKEIFPLMRRQLPNLRFRIVGSKPTEKVLALGQQEGIEVLGFVSDEKLHSLYQESRMVIVPLRYGAGVKGKVVEALHEGAAILTTPCGAEGIPGIEEVVAIEGEEREFAKTGALLYQNIPKLREMGQKSLEFVEKAFSTEAVFEGIREDFGLGKDGEVQDWKK